MDKYELVAELKKIVDNHSEFTTWTVSTPHLLMLVNKAVEAEREEFAKHAVEIARNAIKEEREACAKLCWSQRKYWDAEACADAIRARGNT